MGAPSALQCGMVYNKSTAYEIVLKMISESVIAQINSLAALDGGNRIRKENELIKIIFKELDSPVLSGQLWALINDLAVNFKAPYNTKKLALNLAARAPDDTAANRIINTLMPYEKSQVIKEREIWKKIELLNAESTHEKPPFSAKEKWNKIQKLFTSHDKTGRKVAGRALQEQYWDEAYNQGEYAKVDDKWRDIWLNSTTDLSFNSWCKAVGFDAAKSTAYYSQEERESLRVNLNDGKLFDNAMKPIDTMNCRGYEEPEVSDCVMAKDKSLYCYDTSTAIHKAGSRHHSGILSGQPVLFAGEIGVKNGEIIKITTRSGHYRPTEKNLRDFLSVLKESGVNLNNVVIKDGFGRQISSDAEAYLNANTANTNCFRPR